MAPGNASPNRCWDRTSIRAYMPPRGPTILFESRARSRTISPTGPSPRPATVVPGCRRWTAHAHNRTVVVQRNPGPSIAVVVAADRGCAHLEPIWDAKRSLRKDCQTHAGAHVRRSAQSDTNVRVDCPCADTGTPMSNHNASPSPLQRAHCCSDSLFMSASKSLNSLNERSLLAGQPAPFFDHCLRICSSAGCVFAHVIHRRQDEAAAGRRRRERAPVLPPARVRGNPFSTVRWPFTPPQRHTSPDNRRAASSISPRSRVDTDQHIHARPRRTCPRAACSLRSRCSRTWHPARERAQRHLARWETGIRGKPPESRRSSFRTRRA